MSSDRPQSEDLVPESLAFPSALPVGCRDAQGCAFGLTADQITAEQFLERWALPPEFDEAGKSAMRTKAAAVPVELQAFGIMSDEWIADRVRMLMRQDIWHEAICGAGRDRIMRLSLEVARLQADLDLLAKAGCKVREHEGRRFVEIVSDLQP